jgi:hypothetical protein
MPNPTPVTLTHEDLTWLLRNLTMEIVGACSAEDDPAGQAISARLRRIADGLRQMAEPALSPALRRIVAQLADELDQDP